MRSFEEIAKCPRISWRYLSEKYGGIGDIYTASWRGTVVISTDAGWEHVSVSPSRKSLTPSWDDMCFIKKLFWEDEEAVIQIHPRKSEYINNMPNCLHLWRCTYMLQPLPPKILVGVDGRMSKQEFEQKIKEAYEIAGEEMPK